MQKSMRGLIRLLGGCPSLPGKKSSRNEGKKPWVSCFDRSNHAVVCDEFEYDEPDIGYDYGFNLVWRPSQSFKARGSVLRIFTDGGPIGEYLGGSVTEYLARFLIGKNALAREYLWSNIWRGLRHSAGMGLASIDVALWDLAGKHFDAPIYKLLGYYRKSLPAYASTTHADSLKGGLDSPEAYADFAEYCLKLGYPASRFTAGASTAQSV